MRSIESVKLSVSVAAGTAFLRISLVETGKTLPFRVQLKHTLVDGTENTGLLAAMATEDEAREQFVFHLGQAQKKGWTQALSTRAKLLPGVPDPPSDGEEAPSLPVPAKRGPGRPRRVA